MSHHAVKLVNYCTYVIHSGISYLKVNFIGGVVTNGLVFIKLGTIDPNGRGIRNTPNQKGS